MFFKAISAAQRAQKNIVTTVLLFLHKKTFILAQWFLEKQINGAELLENSCNYCK